MGESIRGARFEQQDSEGRDARELADLCAGRHADKIIIEDKTEELIVLIVCSDLHTTSHDPLSGFPHHSSSI